jgi:hypothetical protein
MDGNVFSNSLYDLGQYLLNNPQGTGGGGQGMPQNAAGAQAGPAGAPAKINTTWTYGSPSSIPTSVNTPRDTGQGNDQVAVPIEAYQQPNLPGAQELPAVNSAQVPQQGGGGGGGAGGGMGAGGAGQGPGTGHPTQNAISGITGALAKGFSQAGSDISSVNTMPRTIEGGAIPNINQVPAQLIGRRPQPAPAF